MSSLIDTYLSLLSINTKFMKISLDDIGPEYDTIIVDGVDNKVSVLKDNKMIFYMDARNYAFGNAYIIYKSSLETEVISIDKSLTFAIIMGFVVQNIGRAESNEEIETILRNSILILQGKKDLSKKK